MLDNVTFRLSLPEGFTIREYEARMINRYAKMFIALILICELFDCFSNLQYYIAERS